MTSTLENMFLPPQTRAGRMRRIRRSIGLGTAVVVLAAAIGLGAFVIIHTCGSLGSGVHKVDRECVGVTDGSYLFDPAFKDIQEKIQTENGEVSKGAYVTVALLDRLTPTETSAKSTKNIRNELEGAYTAQRRNNAKAPFTKKIKLVLANYGTTDAQWQRVLGRLVEMTTGDNPLVAVIGLGVSTARTQQRAMDLSSHNIPMVGSSITADELDYNHIPGLIRVVPANLDSVKALRRYVDSHKELHSAVVVYDTNSDSRGDLFTKSLRDDLQGEMRGPINGRPFLQFSGVSIPGGASQVGFDIAVTSSLCAPPTDVVLYAGRQVDLGGFLDSLEGRQCRGTPLTVIAADDISELLSKRQQQKLRAANLTVVYAGTSDAPGWGSGVEGTPQYYRDFLSAFQDHHFADPDLPGDGVIHMHDAFLTASDAVGLVTASDPSPTAAKVRNALLNLHSAHQVQGASGTLSFSFRPTGAGNPVGKPIPVLGFPPPPNAPYNPQVVTPVYVTQ